MSCTVKGLPGELFAVRGLLKCRGLRLFHMHQQAIGNKMDQGTPELWFPLDLQKTRSQEGLERFAKEECAVGKEREDQISKALGNHEEHE